MSTLPDHLAHLATLTSRELIVRTTVVSGVAEISTRLLPAGPRAEQFETQILAFDESYPWDSYRFWSESREAALKTHEAVRNALRNGHSPEMAAES